MECELEYFISSKKKCYLFVDIGNSTYDFLLTDLKNYYKNKIDSKTFSGLKEYISSIKNMVEKVYISSVSDHALKMLIDNLDDLNYKIIDYNMMKKYCSYNGLKIDNLNILGSDLLLDLVATPFNKNSIVIDLGTASKILYIDKNNVFRGGMIFPGLSSFNEILSIKTERLEKDSLKLTPNLLSLDTQECISSGSINGGAALVCNVVKQIKRQYNIDKCDIYLTGGNSYLIENSYKMFTDEDYCFDQLHTLKGMMKFFKFNYSL